MSNNDNKNPDSGLHRLIDILRGSGKRRKPSSNPELEAARSAKQEQEEVESQLVQVQKMEAIGRVTGGFAHDMSNVLSIIMGAASTLDEKLEKENPLAAEARVILDACRKGAKMTRTLLGFARKGNLVRERIAINETVERIVALLERALPGNVVIETLTEADIRDTEGDRAQIDNTLMNICLNGIDAMRGEGGRLIITTGNAILEKTERKTFSTLVPGKYVQIQVADTGKGMDQLTRGRIFEPFFTTKPAGEGTGLGLSMAYSVVKEHRGVITVETEPGRGTVMSVLLPAIDPSSHRIPLPGTDTVVGAHETGASILVVDDEPAVLRMTRRWLEKLGHTVYLASSGAAAMNTCEEKRGELDLVVLDLFMPEMDGTQVFEGLFESSPGIPILLTSGHPRNASVDAMIRRGAAGFLQKPFDVDELEKTLDALLSGSTSD